MTVRLSRLLLNAAMLATITSLFLKATPFTILAILLTWSYSASSRTFYSRAHGDRLAIYLLLPIVIGLLFSWKNGYLDAVRDMIWFFIPYVYFMAGKKMRHDGIDFRRLIFTFSGVYCVFFLCFTAYCYISEGTLVFESFRSFVSAGSFLTVICILFLFESFSLKVSYFKNPLLLFSPLILVLENSRTYYVCLLILLVSLIKSRIVTKLLVPLIIIVVGVLVWNGNFSNGNVAVFDKLYTELAFKDTWTSADTGTSYRAYETFCGLNTFSNYSVLNMALGGGFGALVDISTLIGVPMLLSGKDYDYIPWLHNGFMYLLVKVGVIGLGFYTLFFVKVLKRSFALGSHHFGSIIRATILGMLVANALICGMFSQQLAFAYILLGVYVPAPRFNRLRETSGSPALA
jgi:hypothetical protein